MADKRSRKPEKHVSASRHNTSSQNRPVAHVIELIREVSSQQVCSNPDQPVARPGYLDFAGSPPRPVYREESYIRKAWDVPNFFGVPAHPLALGLGVNESTIIRLLVIARRLVSRGWVQQVAWCRSDGLPVVSTGDKATHFSLMGALRTAGGGDLVCEYAIKHVRNVLGEWDLSKWNDNPVRTRAHVLALLDECLERAGGTKPRRGGWRIGGVH